MSVYQATSTYTTYTPISTPFTTIVEGNAVQPHWPQPAPLPAPLAMTDPIQKRMAVTFALAVLIVVALVVGAFRLGASQAQTPLAENSGGEVAAGAPPVAALVNTALSPVFTPEVQFWANDIVRWAAAQGIGDPNLVAIIMQIESCGYQDAQSPAGATGLFQVMPFHFQAGENAFDPETNAFRGMLFFADLLQDTTEVGLAFAGYNGGPSVMFKAWENWPDETQRYYHWATGIYQDIQSGQPASPTLQRWLEAGGSSLCHQAAARQATATN